jgi:ribosomal protein L30E
MSRKDEWQNLTSELGFEFKEGVNAFLDSPTLRRAAAEEMNQKDIRQAESMLRNPMVQAILAKIFMGAALGRYRDFEFALFHSSSRGGSSSRSSYTEYVNIALFFPKDLRCDLLIEKAGMLAGLKRLLFSGKYIKIPNNEGLNHLVTVKTTDKSQAKVILAERSVQEQLARLFAYSTGFKVTDYGIRYKEVGGIIGKAKALEIMDIMAEAADRFV